MRLEFGMESSETSETCLSCNSTTYGSMQVDSRRSESFEGCPKPNCEAIWLYVDITVSWRGSYCVHSVAIGVAGHHLQHIAGP